MKFEFINTLKYFFYYKNQWSKASKLGPFSFEKHIELLGNKNLVVSEDLNCKRIIWEDICTMYVFRFSLNGEFQIIERQIWYEYKWFKKEVLMEYVV